jgi:hypothetical protein
MAAETTARASGAVARGAVARGGEQSAVVEQVVKWAVYAGGPFFYYPPKTWAALSLGAGYGRAYAHFRRDHSDAHNLAYHCLCLVLQLTGNVGLLAELDDLAWGEGAWPVLSGGTMALWSAQLLLLAPQCPPPVRLASVATLWAAFAARKSIQRGARQVAYATSVVEALAIQTFVVMGHKPGTKPVDAPLGRPQLRQLLALLAVRLLLQRTLESKFRGELKGSRRTVNLLLALFMLKTCSRPFDGKPPPFLFGLVAWALSILTDQTWMTFYGLGFLATFGQGLSHHYSGEPATLPQLAALSDELAHMTFFPNLLLHSVWQSLKAWRSEP